MLLIFFLSFSSLNFFSEHKKKPHTKKKALKCFNGQKKINIKIFWWGNMWHKNFFFFCCFLSFLSSRSRCIRSCSTWQHRSFSTWRRRRPILCKCITKRIDYSSDFVFATFCCMFVAQLVRFNKNKTHKKNDMRGKIKKKRQEYRNISCSRSEK